ncbi:MAG: nucleoside triphosphate pyrophosphohydrolase [Anaerolineae bacterium]|nr:nucleoside triphosphate pyrophosphohydrolase [Anaerolineae bacterium]
MTLTILGLGPGDPSLLTRAAWDVLVAAEEVWLRTARHPTVAGLPAHLTLHAFDDLYDAAEDFDTVYRTIAAQVLALASRPQGVLYAVPGHPLVGESTVLRILAAARDADVPVRVVEGLSFVGPTLTALEIDALDGLQVCDAIDLAAQHHPPLNPDLPALVGQVYGRALTSDLKLTLMNQYPDEHPVALVHAAGCADAAVVRLPLFELDRQDVAHLTTLYVPPLPTVSSFEGLQETVAHLRAPDGCPWDQKQTHESLRTGLLEEAYEAAEAIDAGDVDALQEELGDLLLQVLLQTQISTEEDDFRMVDVIAGIDAKLKYRHPHVWGGVAVDGAADVLERWERLKRAEKAERTSLLDGVPRALPALQQAYLYGERADRSGFDWTPAAVETDGAFEQMMDGIAELPPEDRETALGDMLLALAERARRLEVEPEAALRKACARFAERFRRLENRP